MGDARRVFDHTRIVSGEDGATGQGGVASSEPSWWEKDAQHVPPVRVCVRCKAEKLAGFVPKILTGYDQSDIDEPLDPAL